MDGARIHAENSIRQKNQVPAQQGLHYTYVCTCNTAGLWLLDIVRIETPDVYKKFNMYILSCFKSLKDN